MKKLVFSFSLTFFLLLSGCAEMQQIANAYSSGSQGVNSSTNAAGLKEALRVGIDSSISALGSQNGFLSDAAVKILLPPEAQPIISNIKLIPGGDKLVNDVVERLNRAAEDAVSEAKPIFVSAITGMTITDATNILFGSSDAATTYLKKTTYTPLENAFQPKVKASLDKKLIGNMSTNDSWRTLTSAYNKVANSLVGKAANMTPVNESLDGYVTQKALDGVFLKVGEEEKLIRENPAARVSSLLKTVFGQLDK